MDCRARLLALHASLGVLTHIEIWDKEAWREVHGHTTPTLNRVISNLRL